MAKVKVRREGNLLWEDECQPLTTEQMNDIKSQFHPSNTANVNIVPYEIYDEDGVEQVVGEVRKTIGGVKKRKPVWERTITGTTADTFALTDLDAICSIDGTYTFGSQGGGTEGATRRFAGTDSTSELYGVLSTVSDSGVLSFVVRGLTGTISIRATFRYTKSSDEWQPV